MESNHRPQAYQACALTTELLSHMTTKNEESSFYATVTPMQAFRLHAGFEPAPFVS